MKRRDFRAWSILFVLIALSSSMHAQDSISQSQKSFLWKVQSRTNTVFVLGSIHYLKKEVYPLDEKIERAFGQSDILVVEANVDDEKRMDLQKLVGRGFYPENETFEKHLSPKTCELVKKELARLEIPLNLVHRQKPWLLAVTLASFEISKLGFDPNYGIDKYFLSKAAERKEILELESFDYQLNLFSRLSGEDQELFLVYTLRDINVLEQELDHLVKAWIGGDVKSLESIITRSVREDKRLLPVYDKLIYKRNRNMALKIENYLKKKKTYFMVVGASHLVGARGIIGILKGRGFLIEQL